MPARSELEREHQRGVALGILVVIVVGLAVYPPVVFGAIVGGGVGLGLARTHGDEERWVSPLALLAIAAVLGVLVVAGEPLGLDAERDRFLEAWSADGVLRPGFHSLADFPWAWVPQTAAIGALAASAAMAIGARR